MHLNLSLAFLISLIGLMCFPEIHILYFAPYLVLSFYKNSRFASLWRAIGCGIIVDLLSSHPHFGLTALNYCLVSWILYGQRWNFFDDKPSTLPLMTLFFSVLSSLTGLILSFFFEGPFPLSLNWVATDLIGMPLFDAAYAFLFSLPFQLTYQLRKIIRARRRAR